MKGQLVVVASAVVAADVGVALVVDAVAIAVAAVVVAYEAVTVVAHELDAAVFVAVLAVVGDVAVGSRAVLAEKEEVQHTESKEFSDASKSSRLENICLFGNSCRFPWIGSDHWT